VREKGDRGGKLRKREKRDNGERGRERMAIGENEEERAGR
jgi:hypothetical protein